MPDQNFNAFDRLRPRVKRETSLVSMAVSAPPVTEEPAELPVVEMSQTTVRLDRSLLGHLADWRFDHRITNDTFFEAAIAIANSDPDVFEKIIADAKERTEQRRLVQQKKRIGTLVEKYKDK